MDAIDPFLYPLRGIAYLATRPKLHARILGAALKSALLSLATVAVLLLVTYRLQSALVARWLGKNVFADITTILLICGEAALPAYLILSNLVDKLQDQLFKEVLKQEGVKLTQQAPGATAGSTSSKEADADHPSATAWRTQKTASQPAANASGLFTVGGVAQWVWQLLAARFLTAAPDESRLHYWARLALSSPLNGIPVLGTLLYALLNGYPLAVSLLGRYLRMRGVTAGSAQQRLLAPLKGDLSKFGLVALALNCIPLLNWLFQFSHTVGAALWAAELERRRGAGGSGASSSGGGGKGLEDWVAAAAELLGDQVRRSPRLAQRRAAQRPEE